MSKVLKTAAIVVGVAALAATGIGLAVGAGAIVAGSVTIGAVAAAASAASAALSLAAQVTAKKPAANATGSQTSFTANPDDDLPYAIGRTGTAGKITYRKGFDTRDAGDNDRQSFVSVLSLGPIKAIEGQTVDKQPVSYTANGAAIGAFAGFMWSMSQLGALPEAQALGFGADAGTPPGWTAQHKLSGKAAASWTLRFDTKAKLFQNGVPAPIWVIEGNLCYDPRKDSTYPGGSGSHRMADPADTAAYDAAVATWEYSENPYLHALKWAHGLWQRDMTNPAGKWQRVVGMGAGEAGIDVAAFVEGANIADANGWTTGGIIYSSADKWEMLKRILQAGMGEPLSLGAKISCLVNAPKVSIATITVDDLAGAATAQVTQPRRDRINTITPRFRLEANNWQHLPGSPISVAEHVALDGGKRSKVQDYWLIQDADQVGTAVRYDIENAREFGPIVLPLKLYAMGYRPGDCVIVRHSEIGLNDQPVLLLNREIGAGSGIVTFAARSETAAKHPFALGQSATPAPTPGVTAPPVTPQPAEGAWTAGAVAAAPEVVSPTIVITGAAAANVDAVIFEYREASPPRSPWSVAGIEPPTTVRRDITGLKAGTAYEVAVSYRSRGSIGDRLVLAPITTGADFATEIVADPDTVTPQTIAQDIRPRVQAQDALWGALLASGPVQAAGAGSAIALAVAAADAARTAAYAIFGPIFDNPGSWATVDFADLNLKLKAVDDALAVLDREVKVGAVPGSKVGDVDAAVVAKAVKLSLQDTAAIVAGGSLSPEAKTYIAKELAFVADRRKELADRAGPLRVATDVMDAAVSAFTGYVTGRPGWADPAAVTPVDAATYNTLRNAAFAAFAQLEGFISQRIAAGSRIAEELVPGNSTVQIVGDQVTRTGTATGYQVVYSKRSTVGATLLKARVPQNSALPVVVGLSRKAGGGTASIASILAGFRVYRDSIGDKWVAKIVNGVEVDDFEGGPFTGDVYLAVGYSEDGTAGRVIHQVGGVGNSAQLTTGLGQEFVFKALLVGGGSVDSVVFTSDDKVPYANVVDGPPANATAGSNIVRPDTQASGATPTADGWGFSFAGNNARLYLVGAEGRPVQADGSEFLNITVQTRADTGVGSAYVLVLPYSAGGAGLQAQQVDARKGGGPVQLPAGTASYIVVQGSDFTSGSIEMTRAVVVPAQYRDIDPSKVAVNTNDAGVDIGFNWVMPFHRHRDPVRPALDPDAGLSLFYPGDANGTLAAQSVNTKYIVLGPVSASAGRVVDYQSLALPGGGTEMMPVSGPPSSTLSGSLVYEVTMTGPGGTNIVFHPVYEEGYEVPYPGEVIENVRTPDGQLSYSTISAKLINTLSGDPNDYVFAGPVPSVILRNQMRLADSDPIADKQLTGVSIVTVAEFDPPARQPSYYVNTGHRTTESIRDSVLGLVATGGSPFVTLESVVTVRGMVDGSYVAPGEISTVEQTATDAANIVWKRSGRVNMWSGDPNAWSPWVKSLDTGAAKPNVDAGDLKLDATRPATVGLIETSKGKSAQTDLLIGGGAGAYANSLPDLDAARAGKLDTGLDAAGRLKTALAPVGAAAPTTIADLIGNIVGTQLCPDPEFRRADTINNVFFGYDNSGSGKTTIALVAGAVPNGTGHYLQIGYDGTGQEGSFPLGPTPGYGGYVCYLDDAGANGRSRPGYYRRGALVYICLTALIPAGRSIQFHSNPYGDGAASWMTSQAGTGTWQRYVLRLQIGSTGAFGTTGFFAVHGGPNVAFAWAVCRHDIIEWQGSTLFTGEGLRDEEGASLPGAAIRTSVGKSASTDVLVGAGTFAYKNTVGADADLSGDIAQRLLPHPLNSTYLRADRMAYPGGAGVDSLQPGEAGANVTETRKSARADLLVGAGTGAYASTLAQLNAGEGAKLGGIETGATAGATIGGNVRRSDGAVVEPDDLLNYTLSDDQLLVTRPRGARMAVNGFDVPGAIRIDLPARNLDDAMIDMTVEVGFYAVEKSGIYRIAGYLYDDQGGRWLAHEVSYTGRASGARPVYLGRRQNGRWAIWIGDPTSTGHYPTATVSSLKVRFAKQHPSLWLDGWSISLDNAARNPIGPEVAVPRPVAGDAFFGDEGNIQEAPGVPATLPNFKTGLGKSARTDLLVGAGSLAYQNDVAFQTQIAGLPYGLGDLLFGGYINAGRIAWVGGDTVQAFKPEEGNANKTETRKSAQADLLVGAGSGAYASTLAEMNAGEGSKLASVSSNAGSTGTWTPLGVGTQIEGNTIGKAPPGVHGQWDAAVIGTAVNGACFVSSSILSPVAGGGWTHYLALVTDSQKTSISPNFFAGVKINTTGSGTGMLSLELAGFNFYTVTVSGLTNDSRLGLVYDGTHVRAVVDGESVLDALVPIAHRPARLYPKLFLLYNDVPSFDRDNRLRDVQSGPWSNTSFESIGGLGQARAEYDTKQGKSARTDLLVGAGTGAYANDLNGLDPSRAGKLDGVQGGADVTRFNQMGMTEAAPIVLKVYSDTGALVPDQLPIVRRPRLKVGLDDRSPVASWSLTKGASTAATIDNTANGANRGAITVTNASANDILTARADLNGYVVERPILISLVAVPPFGSDIPTRIDQNVGKVSAWYPVKVSDNGKLRVICGYQFTAEYAGNNPPNFTPTYARVAIYLSSANDGTPDQIANGPVGSPSHNYDFNGQRQEQAGDASFETTFGAQTPGAIVYVACELLYDSGFSQIGMVSNGSLTALRGND